MLETRPQYILSEEGRKYEHRYATPNVYLCDEVEFPLYFVSGLKLVCVWSKWSVVSKWQLR